jgi:sortase A
MLKRILLIFGVLLVVLWFRNGIEARASRSARTVEPESTRSGGEFENAVAHLLRAEPWCPRALERGEFGRIEIPRLGISALIAEGAEPAQLARAVGHISRTAFPGQPGNSALAGRLDSFLRGLEDVREKDVILINTLQDNYTYEVEWGAVVGVNRVDLLDETAAPSLTLLTCDSLHALFRGPEHFVVRARLVQPTALAAR